MKETEYNINAGRGTEMFHFVYADEDGNGYIDEDYFALGLLGAQFVEPTRRRSHSTAGRRQPDHDSQSHTGGY